MNPLFVQIFLAVLPVVLPMIVSISMASYHNMLQRLPAAQRSMAEDFAHRAVVASEQIGGTGSNKYDSAAKFFSNALSSHGIKLSPEQTRMFIEEAVYYLKADAPQANVVFSASPTSTPAL